MDCPLEHRSMEDDCSDSECKYQFIPGGYEHRNTWCIRCCRSYQTSCQSHHCTDNPAEQHPAVVSDIPDAFKLIYEIHIPVFYSGINGFHIQFCDQIIIERLVGQISDILFHIPVFHKVNRIID